MQPSLHSLMLVNYQSITPRMSRPPSLNTHWTAALWLFSVGLLVAPEASPVVRLRLGGASF